MATYQEILDKVPESVKDKFLIKKRERAIEIVKDKISKSGKSLNDFDDDEMEGMIADEEQNNFIYFINSRGFVLFSKSLICIKKVCLR